MGERPPRGMAVQLLARRAGRGHGRVPDDREDIQGPHGRGIRDDDGTPSRPRDFRGAMGLPRPTGGRRRGRVQRDSAESALPQRVRPAVREDRADSGRQRTGGRGHVCPVERPVRKAVRAERTRAGGRLIATFVTRRRLGFPSQGLETTRQACRRVESYLRPGSAFPVVSDIVSLLNIPLFKSMQVALSPERESLLDGVYLYLEVRSFPHSTSSSTAVSRVRLPCPIAVR